MAMDRPVWTWLIVERQPGQFEDLGFVEVQSFIPIVGDDSAADPALLKLQWRSPYDLQSGVTTLGTDHRTADGAPTQPYLVFLPDGTPQRWYLGREAHRVAIETGLLWSFPQRHLA
jgi:hypothetical protein